MNPKNEPIKSLLDDKESWWHAMLFGALKRYRYSFWTNEEIRGVNDWYHDSLSFVNSMPVPFLDAFRTKKEREEGKKDLSSFFRDVVNDKRFIDGAILSVNHNLTQLHHIVGLWHKRDFSVPGESEAFFAEVNQYMQSQKGSLDRLPYDPNCEAFHNTFIPKSNRNAETTMALAKEKHGFSVVHFIDEDGDYSWDIVIKRETVRFPEAKRVPLTPKAMKLIGDGLDGLDKCDLGTLINLIRNHETFVEPKLRKRFARDLKDGEGLLTSIFDSVIADFLRSLISRYWSPSVGAETMNAKEAEEKAAVMRELLDDLAFETTPEMLCYYVDALGYLYSKGHCFIGESDYEELNELMRYFYRPSQPDWCCFDPKWAGRWTIIFEHEGVCPVSREDMARAICYVLETRMTISSSLALDAWKAALAEHDFPTLKKAIDKAVRVRGSAVGKRKIFF